MATFYLDFVNGNDANAGTSWATAWQTFTSGATAARIAPGDEIRIAKSADPTSIGNATWTSRSGTVTLATAQTATIDNCETSWTAANTATVGRQTTTPVKQGTYVMQITTPATTNTSTLYAYFAVGGASGLDLSAYQEITFWFWNNTSAVADANRYQIRLCSDTAGVTAVDTFNIPAIPSTQRWVPITVARVGGGNLGNAIKSIALYTGTSSPGNSQQIRLDNFSACTTNGLNLRSLISKNSVANWTSNDGWWSLQYIDGTDVRLTRDVNITVANTTTVYYTEGTSPETVTTYIRPAIYAVTMAAALGNSSETIQDSGTAGNLITFSGGWNTSNTTQDGMTFLDGLNGLAYYLTISQSYIKLTNLGFARVGRAFTQSGTLSNLTIENFYITSANNSVFTSSHTNSTFTNILASGNNSQFSFNNSRFNTISNIYFISGANNGISISGDGTSSTNLYSYNVVNSAFSFSGDRNIHKNITAKYATNGILANAYNTSLSNIIINNTTTALQENGIRNVYSKITAATNTNLIGSGAEYGVGSRIYDLTETGTTTFLAAFSIAGLQPRDIAMDYINGSTSDSRYYTNAYTNSSTVGYNVLQQTSVVHTAGGVAPQFNILNTNITSLTPAFFPIARIAVNASSLVTVKCWVKKSHATDIAANIIVKAYEIAGVTADVTASKSNDTNWEELTVTFTPTAKGVVNIYGQAWWVANLADESVYFDDVTVTQA